MSEPHVCLTGCAHTYREARERDQQKKERMKEKVEQDNLRPPAKERKTKSFCISKLGPVQPDPLEGSYRQFQVENYEAYMEALGAGQMSRNLILRSNVVVQINEVLMDNDEMMTA